MQLRAAFRWASLSLLVLVGGAITAELRLRAQALAQADQDRQAQAIRIREINRLRELERDFFRRQAKASKTLRDLQPDPAGDPEVRDARVRAAQLGGIRIRYGPLWRKLGLSSAQVAAFEQLALEGAGRLHDLKEAARMEDIPADSQALLTLESGQRDETRQREGEMLGPEGVAELKEFEDRTYVRAQVLGMAGDVYDRDPLRPDQVDATVAILAQASPESGADVATRAAGLEKLQAKLAPILSPVQLSSLMLQVRGDLGSDDVNARADKALKAAGLPSD